MLHLITQSASSCISDGLGCTREIAYVIFKIPGEVLIIPFDRLFSELQTSHRNPYLKAVDDVIHVQLRDSRKTT